MKILVGVDTNCTYKPALYMCARLRFPNASWTMAHSVEAVLSLPRNGSIPGLAQGVDFARLGCEAGQRALERAAREARENGLPVDQALLTGNVAESLMHFADANASDLIAVHSERKGHLGSFFLGSASRGLAISAKQSVLITKGEAPATGPVSAVFATDFSPYAHCALKQLLKMAPAGLKKIHVMTSVNLTENDPYFRAGLQIPVEKKLVEDARDKVCRVADDLSAAGYFATGHVYNLPVNEAINRAMANAGAELLILGAQGHGFLHRLALGSTALHQVVVEPYSVLLVRPSEE